MSQSNSFYALGAGLALLIAASGASQAQTAPPSVSYTLKVDESGQKGASDALRIDVAEQGAMARYDTTVNPPSGSAFHIINIVDGTAGKLYTFDPKLKVYTVSDTAQVRPELFGTGTVLPSFSPSGQGFLFPFPDTRIASQNGGVGIAAAVTDEGLETVGKTKNAHHYTVNLAYSTSGAAEVPYPTQSFEIWTDDAQPQPINAIDARLLDGGANGVAVGGATYKVTGDVDLLRAVLSKVPVKISYNSGSAAGTITYTLDKLAVKPLDASFFAAPDSKQREVANADFNADEHAAIMGRLGGDPNYQVPDSSGIRSTGPATDPISQGLNSVPTIPGG